MGRPVIAALNPLSYGSNVTYDLSKTPPAAEAPTNAIPGRPLPRYEDWVKRIDINGKLTGLFTDYHYVGTGGHRRRD